MTVAVVILAAGASSRMGSPKALLEKDGERAVEKLVRAARALGATPVVVLGKDADVVRKHADLDGAVVVENPDPDAGRTGSLTVGLAAAPEAEVAVVWPVDHAAVAPGTVGALLAAAGLFPRPVFVPTFDGRRGHPIVLRGPAVREAAKLPADQPLRDWLRDNDGFVYPYPVEDPAILANLDTPDEAEAAGWTAHR